MMCFRCGKQVKGTGRSFVPTYRLQMMAMHVHEDCKKDKPNWQGIVDIIKVRVDADMSTDHIAEAILKYTGFDKKKFERELLKAIKESKKQ